MRSRNTLSFSTSQRPTRAGGFHSPTAVMTRAMSASFFLYLV
nr:MAG TPA: hypothetical protein [Caudoviricetes sp.]